MQVTPCCVLIVDAEVVHHRSPLVRDLVLVELVAVDIVISRELRLRRRVEELSDSSLEQVGSRGQCM